MATKKEKKKGEPKGLGTQVSGDEGLLLLPQTFFHVETVLGGMSSFPALCGTAIMGK